MNDRDRTLEQIKHLRRDTRAAVTLCREALEACAGDYDRALAYVQERRKAPAGTGDQAGAVFAYVHQERIGVLVELRCATDFVARTDEFRRLGKELTLQVAGAGADGLLDQPCVRDARRTVRALVDEVSRQVGEPVAVRRAVRWDVGE